MSNINYIILFISITFLSLSIRILWRAYDLNYFDTAISVIKDIDLLFYRNDFETIPIKHIGICIVGQASRLEIYSKLNNLVEYNSKKIDRKLFIVGIFDSGASYSNKGATVCYNSSYDMKKYFYKYFQIPNVIATAQFSHPSNYHNLSIHTKEVLRYYRKEFHGTEWYQRIENHLRQFEHDSKCYQQLKQIESKYKIEFDTIIRLRDNAIITKPIDIVNMMNSVKYQKAITKKCKAWGGYSDKVWFIPKKYMKAVLAHVVNDTLQAKSYLRYDHPHNSEQLVKHVWDKYQVMVSLKSANQLPVVDGRCHSSSLFYPGTELIKFDRVSSIKDCWPIDKIQLEKIFFDMT